MHPVVLFFDADKGQIIRTKLCLDDEFSVRILIRYRGVVHCALCNDLLHLRRGHVLRFAHCLPAFQRIAVIFINAAKLYTLRLCSQFDLDFHWGGRISLPRKVV